jgi:hypothetical protein
MQQSDHQDPMRISDSGALASRWYHALPPSSSYGYGWRYMEFSERTSRGTLGHARWFWEFSGTKHPVTPNFPE